MRIFTFYLLLSALPAAMAGAQSDTAAPANPPAAVQQPAPAPGDLPGMQPAPAAPRIVLPAEDLVIEVPKADSDDLAEGPWAVAEAAVKGTVNLKPKAVLKAGKARKGRVYMKDFVQDDIEAILTLGSVDKVSVDLAKIPGAEIPEKLARTAGVTEAVRVTYIVTEKPLIRSLDVSGNKGLSKGRVKDEMTLKKKDYFDELKVREDLIKIADMYREKGYIDIQTDYEVKFDSAASACDLVIKVTEGNKARVAAVRINGAGGFPQKKLIKKFKNRPKKIYAPQELASDMEKLKEFYKNNGYADFSVDRSSVSFNENRSSATIDITITEGNKIKFGGSYFSGNSVYLPSDLLPLVEYRRGKYFSQEKLDDTVRALQDKYADKGYLKASITPQRNFVESTGETDITFLIGENTQIFVDHIDVEGNKATKTHVLRREITQKEGEVFSSSKIRRSQEKIFNLGFIDDVSPVINPTADPDKVDLVFDVTEGKPGMLTAGAGISSTDGLVGTLSMSHMNLFGRAQRMSLSWNFGKRVQDYYLSWTTPWIGNSPTSLGLDAFNTRHYKPYRDTISAYTERRSGGKISVAPRFSEDKYQLRTSYTYEQVRITDVDEVYLGELQEGTSVTSSVYVELSRDTRDNVWDPTRGTKTSLGFEYAGGPLQGDVNYYKPTLSYSYNLKLFSIDDYPFVMSFANRFGFVGRFGDTRKVPVYERYFLGGAETIRGYSNNGQVGPLNGGRVYDVANLEFKIPLAREKRRTIVQWGFFLDAGNSWDGFDKISTRFGTGTTDMKAGAGFGIRFTTPAFPIRLDWGYGFNHKPGEQRSDIYFTLGNLF